jgi:hypothetical protein
MATEKDRERGSTHSQSQQQQRNPPPRQEPERQPAQSTVAKPGVPQPDQQPRPEPPEEKKPEEKVLEKEQAMQLFRAGHRLKIKGDPQEKWFSASRLHGALVICYPVDEEIEKTISEQELVLADESTQP